jgi:hypothetical protein
MRLDLFENRLQHLRGVRRNGVSICSGCQLILSPQLHAFFAGQIGHGFFNQAITLNITTIPRDCLVNIAQTKIPARRDPRLLNLVAMPRNDRIGLIRLDLFGQSHNGATHWSSECSINDCRGLHTLQISRVRTGAPATEPRGTSDSGKNCPD